MFKVRSLAMMSILACAAVASADTMNVGLVDGVKGSEWSNADIIGTFNPGQDDQVVVYAQQDANYIYVAYQYEGLNSAKDFDGVNHYVDSWQDGGVYGDGDDVVIEGGNYHWAYSLDGSSSGIWESTPTPFATLGTGQYGDTANGVYEGYLGNTNSDFAEFAINKSLVNWNDYSTIEIGGQAWTYGLNFVEIDPADVAPVSTAVVPLPASIWGGLSLMGLIGAAACGRRRVRCA